MYDLMRISRRRAPRRHTISTYRLIRIGVLVAFLAASVLAHHAFTPRSAGERPTSVMSANAGWLSTSWARTLHLAPHTAKPAVAPLAKPAAAPVVVLAAPVAPAAVAAAPVAAAAPAPPAVVAPAPSPSIAAMVAQVEASGIVPGPSWTWSMGDATGLCHFAAPSGQPTGCTVWGSGSESTVFTGPVNLALVAHELGNAETSEYAPASLMAEVTAAEAGTSWSPTDATASCLVAHFMGFQDQAAGSWNCPPALATEVSTHIHDVVTTMHTVATCGAATGLSSTLTFGAGTGTLTVTTPTGTTLTAGVGGTIVTSGIGTFTADDVGATATLTGLCNA